MIIKTTSQNIYFNHNKDFVYDPRGFNSIEESNNT